MRKDYNKYYKIMKWLLNQNSKLYKICIANAFFLIHTYWIKFLRLVIIITVSKNITEETLNFTSAG